MNDHKDLARRFDDLEKKYDTQFKVVFDGIRQLTAPLEPGWRRIGIKQNSGGGMAGEWRVGMLEQLCYAHRLR